MGVGPTEFPSGIVTLMFSDIQGSCDYWERHGEGFRAFLERHNSIVRGQVAAHHGHEVGTEGDAFMVVFQSARDALHCAVNVQRAIAAADWAPLIKPLRIRLGLHTGEPILATHPNGKVDYLGPVVNRSARIMQSAHGGQIVIGSATRELVATLPSGAALIELGEHRLKGLGLPERLFQVNYDGVHTNFPPLITLNAVRHNLPVLLTSFVGRKRETAELEAILRLPQTRLLTLHGLGGTGKTRLAQHVAAEVAAPQDDGSAAVRRRRLVRRPLGLR
jgi:class 3 adenylate cyclase